MPGGGGGGLPYISYRNGDITMFSLHFPFTIFNFSETLSSFALTSKARIILHSSRPFINFQNFQENINVNLTFAVCHNAILKPCNENTHFA